MTAVVVIEEGRVAAESTLTRARRWIDDIGTVVLACGGRAVDDLYHSLKGQIPEVHAIRDALAPSRLIHAVHDGARVGHAI